MLRKLTNGAAISTFLEEENMRAIDGIKAAVEMCNAQTIIKCISMFQSIMALKKIIGKIEIASHVRIKECIVHTLKNINFSVNYYFSKVSYNTSRCMNLNLIK